MRAITAIVLCLWAGIVIGENVHHSNRFPSSSSSEEIIRDGVQRSTSSGSTLWSSTANSSRVLQWIQVPNDELFLKGLEPAGIENGRILYLAQATHFSSHIHNKGVYYMPSALKIGKDIKAVFGVWGVEHTYFDFRILDAPSGTLSWIPFSGSVAIPSNAVVGGRAEPNDGGTYYVCRANHLTNHLIPGRYLSSSVYRSCYYSFNGIEHVSNDNLELLVVNKLGMAMGLRP